MRHLQNTLLFYHLQLPYHLEKQLFFVLTVLTALTVLTERLYFPVKQSGAPKKALLQQSLG